MRKDEQDDPEPASMYYKPEGGVRKLYRERISDHLRGRPSFPRKQQTAQPLASLACVSIPSSFDLSTHSRNHRFRDNRERARAYPGCGPRVRSLAQVRPVALRQPVFVRRRPPSRKI